MVTDVQTNQWTELSSVECDFQNLGKHPLLFTNSSDAPVSVAGFKLMPSQLEHYTPPLGGKLWIYNPNFETYQVEVLSGNAFK